MNFLTFLIPQVRLVTTLCRIELHLQIYIILGKEHDNQVNLVFKQTLISWVDTCN